MLKVIGQSWSDLTSSDDEEDVADKEVDEDDTALQKVSEDVEPDWVMGAICRSGQHRTESNWQKKMKLDKFI